MSHHTGDNLVGIGGGVLLSMLASVSGSLLEHAGEVLLFGFLGGAAGLLGKMMVERLARAAVRSNDNNNNDNNKR